MYVFAKPPPPCTMHLVYDLMKMAVVAMLHMELLLIYHAALCHSKLLFIVEISTQGPNNTLADEDAHNLSCCPPAASPAPPPVSGDITTSSAQPAAMCAEISTRSAAIL